MLGQAVGRSGHREAWRGERPWSSRWRNADEGRHMRVGIVVDPVQVKVEVDAEAPS